MIDAPANQHGGANTPPTHPIPRPQLEPPPAVLGAYRLFECLGTGGYASVYRARRITDSDTCDVALKRLHPHLMSDVDAVRAFGREARLAVLLDHPTIRRVYSLVREPGALFMTMEYVEGVTLFDLLRRASAERRRFPLAAILTLLHRLCDALHYAHERVDELGVRAGFVHRDISPSNLMIAPRGRLKLIDLGVATTQLDDQGPRGRPLKVQGKFGYMAPEVLLRAPYDRRADVFSVGVVAWELLTLCRLYPVSKPPVDVELVRSRPVAAPSTFDRRCPADLDAIVLRALDRDPRARWPSCAAMADALTRLALGLGEAITDTAVAPLVEEPAAPPRLARGTSPPSAAAVPPTAERVIAVPRRCGRVLAAGGVAGSLATLLVAGIAPKLEHHAVAPPVSPAVHVPVAPPVRAPTAPPPLPPSRPLTMPLPTPPSPPVRIEGSPPRSWSAAYPYRARLCIDLEGKVSSVAILEGPSRLEGRITRALRRWRYAPVERATCFDVRANVEKVAGR